MYLQKLVINGFKSFVKKTSFEFNQPFTAIVGPNGGGKTNVVDALRWVMGEQSPKLLRIKKSEDAIFSGSPKLARSSLAQVDLHLNNEDNRLNLEYAEVVITRKVYRNGESEYLINKKPVRLADIVLLLAQANFGQKSYGVIGQGMITDILNANPQDRKDFFDEATGVKEFQIKRDQSINKLIRTEDNLTRAEDILVEIEPRLHSLQRQVKKLEKRQELEKQLAEIQVVFYGSLWQELKNKLKLISAQKQEQTQQKSSTENEIKQVQKLMDEFSVEESREALFQKLQQKYSDYLTQQNSIIKEQVVLKGKLEIEHEKQGSLNLVWLQRKNEELNHLANQHQLEITHLQGIIKQQEIRLNEKLEQEKKSLKNFKDLEYNILKAKEDLQKKTEVLSVPEIRERLVNIFSEQENFLKRLLETHDLEAFKSIQKEAKAITAYLAKLLDELHDRNNEDINTQRKKIEILDRQLLELANQKEENLAQINELKITIQNNKDKISLWSNDLQQKNDEKNKLTQEISTIEKNQQQKVDQDTKLKEYQKQNKLLSDKLQAIELELLSVQNHLNKFNEEEEFKKQKLLRLQNQQRDHQQQLNNINNQINQLDIEATRTETKLEDTEQEILKEVKPELHDDIKKWQGTCNNRHEIDVQIANIKHQLDLIGSIDQETITEYQTTRERYDYLQTQTKDLRSTISKLETVIDELDVTIKKQFNKSFQAIADSFQKYFTVIFQGGEAKLSLITEEEKEEATTNPNTPEAESAKPELIGKKKKKQKIVSGIEIEATPPGKKVKNVHALSGGEKSMTAIALICAIIAANTPPFVVLDEVEAALDEANSEKFSAIIKQLSHKTQFITITHNRATMHQADLLYGVTMGQEGASNILSVKLEEAQKMVNEEVVDKNK